ncbi:MAG: riboflavin biosynthesis protein RibF [Pseudomonadota bacterium]
MEPLVLLSSASCRPRDAHPVLTVGNFDGVHRGHRVLLDCLVARARALGRPAMVYTFHPPPAAVLGRQPHLGLLQVEDKVALLGRLGVEQVCIERFSPALAARSPAWFAGEVLGRRLQPSAMVVGHDFRFGTDRGGDHAALTAHLPGMPVEVVPPLVLEGEIVSSTRVRACLLAGRVGEATALLGRPHFLRGTVVPGDRRGRELGFPTANLLPDTELLPAGGVYAGWAQVDGGEPCQAVTNLGARPTVGGGGLHVEVHILAPEGVIGADALYGREVKIHFIRRLRGEVRFPDLPALVAQIHEDIAAARASLGAPPDPW